MPFKYTRTTPKPRPSRAKPKKTKTCPICAQNFKASRSDQNFCSATCRARSHRGIPDAVVDQAQALRDKRTEAQRKAKGKRDAERERKVKAKAAREAAIAAEAPIREKWIAAIKADMRKANAQDDPEFRPFWDDQIEKAKTTYPLPDFAKRMFG